MNQCSLSQAERCCGLRPRLGTTSLSLRGGFKAVLDDSLRKLRLLFLPPSTRPKNGPRHADRKQEN